ncbi:MAG: YggT family protein [Anaerolineales bacterium]|jgi:YggT family protein
MLLLIRLINIIVQLLTLLIIVDVVLSYFMSPFHPVREALDRIVNPMLNPIRRVIPPLGGLDLSPIVLLILIQVLGSVLRNFLLAL